MPERMNPANAARLFAELGNRTRLEILRLLIKGGPCGLAISEVQRHLDIPASTLAFHLNGLVRVELVRQEKRGRVVLCRPCVPALDAAMDFLRDGCCTEATPGQSAQTDAGLSRSGLPE
jgi:ArsR family transcriptional regulator